VDAEGKIHPELEQIVDRRLIKKNGCDATEVLIRWQGDSSENDSWELLWTLQSQFPHLVGKVL